MGAVDNNSLVLLLPRTDMSTVDHDSLVLLLPLTVMSTVDHNRIVLLLAGNLHTCVVCMINVLFYSMFDFPPSVYVYK